MPVEDPLSTQPAMQACRDGKRALVRGGEGVEQVQRSAVLEARVAQRLQALVVQLLLAGLGDQRLCHAQHVWHPARAASCLAGSA